jgi:endonuclease/exonuclease/phosphatase family metal-dependent hydrolase
MKKIFLFIIFFLTISVFSQVRLKVITYNIMGMKPGTDPQSRLHYIIENLKLLNPDIIGLQEINESLTSGGTDNQAKVIADSLSSFFGLTYHYYYSQTHLSWNNQYKEFIGIISKYPVVQESYYQLVAGVFPRKVVWNYINTPLGKINFFNTHLDYQSTSVRVQQVQQILNFVSFQENLYPAIATILTGDFNDIPGSQPIDLLITNSFRDTWAQVNPSQPGFTVPSNSPTSKIDFIFTKLGSQLIVDSSWIIMDQPYSTGLYCSDHLGILSLFSINPSSDKDKGSLDAEFNLFQNYPNPFNPKTRIGFKLSTSGFVSLKVYDNLGNNIATLLNEEKYPGIYDVDFSELKSTSGSMTSGIYYYQLKAGNSVITKKMNFLK